MNTHAIKTLCAVTAIATLAACAGVEKRAMEQPAACDNSIAPGVEVTGLPAMKQIMKQFVTQLAEDKLARKILKNGKELDDVVTELEKKAIGDKKAPGHTLAEKIKIIRESDFASGLAGVSVRSFLDGADQTLEQGNFKRPVKMFRTEGKLEAYFYDDGPKKDCLRVLMVTRTLPAQGKVRKLAYRWTVFGQFQVAHRKYLGEPGYDPKYVFPDAVGAPPISEETASKHDFRYKLWAVGNSIEVTRVERSVDDAPFDLLPPNDPLYQTTAASCIDMMFQPYPPRTLPPKEKPPFYCLGRCAHPPIINTK